MKKSVLLALLGLSMAACSNEENEAAPVAAAKGVEAPSVTQTKPQATSILAKYRENKSKMGYNEATAIFASDCKSYLTENGHSTTGLNDAQIINLFFKNF